MDRKGFDVGRKENKIEHKESGTKERSRGQEDGAEGIWIEGVDVGREKGGIERCPGKKLGEISEFKKGRKEKRERRGYKRFKEREGRKGAGRIDGGGSRRGEREKKREEEVGEQGEWEGRKQRI